MLPVGEIVSADEGLIYKFKHYRIPEVLFDLYRKGRPNDSNLLYYSPRFGFPKYFVDEWGFTLPDTKGGKTVCEIWKGNQKLAEGVSYCSYSDNFCYRIGRRIALGRALKELNKK